MNLLEKKLGKKQNTHEHKKKHKVNLMLSTIMNLLRRKNLEKKKKLSQLNSCSSRESQLFGKRIWKKKKKKKNKEEGG